MQVTCNIFGIPISSVRKEDYLAALRNQSPNIPLRIFTPNTEIMLQCATNPRLHTVLRSADLLVPDGFGVVIASHILQNPLPCRSAGIDIALEILKEAQVKRQRVFLLGGAHNVAKRAGEQLQKQIPGLIICGTHHGYFKKEEETDVLHRIQQAKPNVLFVCLGFPKQEEWINRYASAIHGLQIAAGLGGSLDVWSGSARRAPIMWQKMGMEWLWRVLHEPHRWRIFYRIPQFLLLVYHQKLQDSHKIGHKHAK